MLKHKSGLNIWLHDAFTGNVNFVTHSALHHADEVVATVMLAVLGEVDLWRTRDREFVESLIGTDGLTIIDIGGVYDHEKKTYDHHQNDPALIRDRDPKKVKRAATGLVWRHYGEKILCVLLDVDENSPTEAELNLIVNVYEYLEHGFIRAIDAFDNGVEGIDGDYGLSQLLPLFNVDWDDKKGDDDEAFLDACVVADLVFRRLVQKTAAMMRGKRVIDGLIHEAEGSVIVMPAPIDDWVRAVLNSPEPTAKSILFAVYPARGGHWSVQALPPDEQHMFDQRLPFPKDWRGQSHAVLTLLTGITSIETCHPGGFFASCGEMDDAVALANLAVEKGKKESAEAESETEVDGDPNNPPDIGANPT